MMMRLSFNLPIHSSLALCTSFVILVTAETSRGAEPEEVLAVHTNSAVPTLLYIGAMVWIGVGVYCLLNSRQNQLLRFLAMLSLVTAGMFGLMGALLTERVELSQTGVRFCYRKLSGKVDVRIPFDDIGIVRLSYFQGRLRLAPYTRYHHRWEFVVKRDARDRLGIDKVNRRFWFVNSEEQEDALIDVLRQRGVTIEDHRRGSDIPY